MYIKQVVIQGFKSYKEQTIVEPFDPGHNVVVGRNGSGKSNFFYAIQFVLSDEFSHLSSEQRQALLYEGTGPRVISAYVEIIFDNSDQRLPIDKNEVYLRRMIGSKKDQYFLNKKLVTKNDVINLLESAGFSKSNPYYIVKQGKINQMATAPDSQRLKLLREVAGTKVYDDKREESLAILKETEKKMQKIQEFLHTIEEKMQTLSQEKEELQEYQKWDNQRRALEYVLHERELKENKNKLEELIALKARSGKEQATLTTQVRTAREKVKSATKKHKEAIKEAEKAKKEQDILSSEQQQLLKEKTRLSLKINDLEEEVKGDNDNRLHAEKELGELQSKIALKKAELESTKLEYENMKQKEDEISRTLALKEQRRKELYAKQGRGSQFKSKEERDKWIHDELKKLNKQIEDKKEHEKKILEDIKKDEEKRASLENKIQQLTLEMESERASFDKNNEEYHNIKKLKDECQAARKENYRQENMYQFNLSGLKEDLIKADQNLRSMVGKPILNGRDSVLKVLDTFKKCPDMQKEVSNYHGLVIENFDCDKTIYMAVEVTSGNRLFHHIVETDKFGTKILKEMNNQGLPGEVTFMPLNRLHIKNIDYPKTPDAIPMISKLKYDPKYENAFRYLFGKTLICRNLEAATSLARYSGLDCVTLDGDQVSSKGSLTGGYFNTMRSRLETQKTRSELKNLINSLENELSMLKKSIEKDDNNISMCASKMQKIETKNSKSKDVCEKIKSDIRNMKQELDTIERCRLSKEKSLQQCESNIEAMDATKKGLEKELRQDLIEQLSAEEQEEVNTLNEEIICFTKENKETFAKRIKLEAQKNKLENLLINNLIRRNDELVQSLHEISIENRPQRLETSRVRLSAIDERLLKINAELESQNKKVIATAEKQKTEAFEVEKMINFEKEAQEKMESDAKDSDKLTSKINIFQQKISDLTQKISELGTIPNKESLTQFDNKSIKELFKKMEKINNHLKKYSHVNKKALDQFLSFSEQREKLIKRKEELDRANEKIKELMIVLEQKKYEAILFTFKQVSKYFSEVFKKLVPLGQAELIMKTADDEDNDEALSETVDYDQFVGVGIKVSFTGRKNEMKEMNQLSGGEKSIVALANIFAIQKCDPAPFYLFDEIDQALDAQHRKAVADMIHELSSEAQFITTTFRPELLQHANKFYGVKFRNKVSHVECVTREEAYDFVEDDQTYA